MVRTTVPRALLCAFLFVGFLPVRSFAGCNVAIVHNIAPTDPNGTATNGQITISTAGVPAVLQHESKMERVSDVLIFDDTAIAGGNCFASANQIKLSYTGQLSNPSTVQANPTNFDVYDSATSGGLGITALSYTAVAANAPITIVELDVQNAGTAATAPGGITQHATGSAIRVKNLRFDATVMNAGDNLKVTVTANGMPVAITGVVGIAQDTVAPGAGVTQEGAGTQSAGDTLSTPAIFDYAENYTSSFRVASQNATGVAGDVATTATRVIYDLGTSLPWGVSVNFPALIQVGGVNGLTLTLHSGGSCTGPVQCTAVYDTTSSGIGTFDLQTTTAVSPNTGQDGNSPAIGVFIANPSGFGNATMTVSIVPSHIVTAGDVPIRILNVGLIGSAQVGNNTLPVLASMSPNTAVAGAAATTLSVTGSNFTSSSVVQWNGSARPTTFVSSTQLTASLTAADLASAGAATVNVLSGGNVSNSMSFLLTTNPKSTSPLQYILPHVISGNGYASRVTIVNLSAQQNSVVLNFISQAGATISSNTYNMAPGATVRVNMSDAERYGNSVTKWATVGSQAPVLANIWYDYQGQGSTNVQNSVGFNDATPMTDFSLPVEFQPAVAGINYGKTVGLALANPNGVAATATVKLIDSSGNVVVTQTVNLPAYGQTAIDLQQAAGFGPALPSSDFVGSITVSATQPVSSIAVQDNDGLFSAVPVGSGRAK